jgi:HSP20 family protein
MLMRFDPFRTADWMLGRGTLPLPMDAVRRADAVVVEIDLPGVDPDSIDMTVERNVLHLSAERPAPRTEGLQVLAQERPYGRFTRQLHLGEGLDTDRIDASYDAGVLRITIPVTEHARPRRIAIEHGNGAQAISAAAS